MTNHDDFTIGGIPQGPIFLRDFTPEFRLTGVWNGSGALPAFSTVFPGTPQLAESGALEIPEPIFPLRINGDADRDAWGILLEELEPGACGKVAMAGIAPARLDGAAAAGGFVAPDAEGRLRPVPRSRARLLCSPGEAGDNELALLLLSAYAVPVYAGYFTLALRRSGDDPAEYRVRVVDGATYDGSTLASSGNSTCKVNNRVFSVAPWESGSVAASPNGTRIIALRFTPGSVPAQDVVEIVMLDLNIGLPNDSESASYYQLGRLIISYGSARVVQDHTSGVAQLWWYFLCR